MKEGELLHLILEIIFLKKSTGNGRRKHREMLLKGFTGAVLRQVIETICLTLLKKSGVCVQTKVGDISRFRLRWSDAYADRNGEILPIGILYAASSLIARWLLHLVGMFKMPVQGLFEEFLIILEKVHATVQKGKLSQWKHINSGSGEKSLRKAINIDIGTPGWME